MTIPFVSDETTKAPGLYMPQQNLIRVVASNAGPFTYTGTGTYIPHSNGHCVIIDPGPDEAGHVENILKAVGALKVEAILVTHTHRDHSPASAAIKAATNAPILGCKPAPKETGTASISMDESQDQTYTPDRVLTDQDKLDFKSGAFEVVATPGHLSNHLCFHWRAEDALFTGDHIMGWATSVVIPPDGNMADYMASLRKIRTLAPSSLWPTHGQPVRAPAPFIDALIAHREAREASILEQIRGGTGRIMDIVKTLYSDVPETLHIAAAHSVLAHIEHLIDQNLIITDQSIDIEGFYVPKA